MTSQSPNTQVLQRIEKIFLYFADKEKNDLWYIKKATFVLLLSDRGFPLL